MNPSPNHAAGTLNSVSRFLDYYNRTILTALLIGVFAGSLALIPWSQGIVHGGGAATALEILTAMVQPDLSAGIVLTGLRATAQTLAYATCGMSLAILLAVPLGIFASGTLARGGTKTWVMRAIGRPILGAMRAIHELVWAWLFVAAMGLSPMAAIIALAIPYGGILGRILADQLKDVDSDPLESLRCAGASELQVLLFGRLPQALADVLSYTLFRYECSIRSAAIMSFIGLGGLGYQIQISLDDLHFAEAWTFVYFLVGLVVAVGYWSHRVRKALVS